MSNTECTSYGETFSTRWQEKSLLFILTWLDSTQLNLNWIDLCARVYVCVYFCELISSNIRLKSFLLHFLFLFRQIAARWTIPNGIESKSDNQSKSTRSIWCEATKENDHDENEQWKKSKHRTLMNTSNDKWEWNISNAKTQKKFMNYWLAKNQSEWNIAKRRRIEIVS